MTELRVVGSAGPEPNTALVLTLEGLLARARAGEITELAVAWRESDVYDDVVVASYWPHLGAHVYRMAHEMLTRTEDEG